MNRNHSFRRNVVAIFRRSIIMFMLVFSFWILNIQPVSGTENHHYYFPHIFDGGQFCEQNQIVNGNFEQDDFGWQIYSNAWGWKIHDLIGSKDEGFSPFRGDYAASLGGYEGITDYIEQKVVIPEKGQLTYWWKMHTSERQPYIYDGFYIDIYETDQIWVARLEYHNALDVNGIWQQDVVDLSAFEGRTFILRFEVYNNNYEGSGFYLDEIQLCSWID